MAWDIGNFSARQESDGAYSVLIAGGASGIGKATAELLAGFGATVIIADRMAEQAKSVARQITANGGLAFSTELEITNNDSVLSAVTESERQVGGAFHGVINAVGIVGASASKGYLQDMEEFEQVCRINLLGAMMLSKCVLPAMVARSYGRILHIASVAGKEGNAGMAAYSASKSGLIGLVKSLAKDVSKDGVTINALAPGVVKTPLVDALPKATVDTMAAKIPMGRCGTPEEAARMIAFIISPACSFTTGFVFDLSGGRATY